MPYEAIKGTDNWIPVRLISATNGTSPITGLAYTTPSIWFAEAGTTLSTAYSPTTGQWYELASQPGSYWLLMGQDEFPSEKKYIVTVTAANAISYSAVVEVRDRAQATTDDDVIAIKAKTDNLPTTPAAAGDAMALTSYAITNGVIATGAYDSRAFTSYWLLPTQIATNALQSHTVLAVSNPPELSATGVTAIASHVLGYSQAYTSFDNAGSVMEALNTIRQVIAGAATGNSSNNVMTYYERDGSTPRLTVTIASAAPTIEREVG